MEKMFSIDANAPLTHEELASFYAASMMAQQDTVDMVMKTVTQTMSGIIDSYNKQMSNLLIEFKVQADNIAEAINKLPDQIVSNTSLKAISSSISDLVKAVAPARTPVINPLLTGSKSPDDVTAWIKDAWKSAEIIGVRSNKAKVAVMRDIYSMMRTSGVDVNSLYEEYKSMYPNQAKIRMCAESDYLRQEFEARVKELHRKYYPEKYVPSVSTNSKKYPSTLVNSTPEHVKNLAVKYAAKHNIKEIVAYRKMYSAVIKRFGINRTAFLAAKKSYCNKIGYSNCSTGYFIASNKKLLSILDSVVEEG